MGDKYLSKETARITISYNGKEKKIPLIVQPSPQLSDAQAQSALESVTRLVQQIFKIVDSRNFTLRDSFSYYNKLTKNSFRQVDFPLKWNVVFDKKESDETMLRHGGVLIPPSAGLYSGHSAEVLSRTSYPSRFHTMSHEMLSSTRSDPFANSQISFPVDMGKNVSINGDNGSYGFLLRHFSIKECHEPSQENELRAASPDSERMSTVFVYKLQPNGPAKEAGLNEGDKVYSINRQSITRCSLEQIQRLLLMSHQEMVLQVSPRSDDVLQLFRYAPLAYGPTGEHMTKLGRAWVYDVNISQCSDWLKDDISVGPSNHIDSHDHVTTPSAGSSSSHDNMVTPPATTHMSSSENSSRYASPMANSPVIGGSHSSSGSHIMDDVYITGSLSEIPVSPTTSLHEWVLDREDSQSPVDHMRSRSNTSSLHYSHVRTLSPHPPSLAVTHRRSSPDPYHDSLLHNDHLNDVTVLTSKALHLVDISKSSSYTLLDHSPPNSRVASTAGRKNSLQHKAASSPSLDHVGSDHNEPQQPQSISYNHDSTGRTAAVAAATSNRRGSKLSLEDLTRIEPCRDVKKKTSHEEQNGDLLDMYVEKPQMLSPIEDGHSSVSYSQEFSLSGNTPLEVTYQRSNKKSYSSQRERLHRSLSKPLAGTSQSASSDGSYSFDYSLSADHVGKSPSVTTDTSQIESDSNTGSSLQEFSRPRANSFKQYLESSLHEAFPSLDDDEEEPTALEVKSVQHSQDELVKSYGATKMPPLNDHVVNHLSTRDTSKGFSPGTSPKKPHRIVMHDDSASQPYYVDRSKTHTIERVFSDGNFQEQKKKTSGSIFAHKHRVTDKQRSVDDQLLARQMRPSDSIILQQAICHGLLYRKVEKEAGRRSHDRSWKCFYSVLKDNYLFFYKDRSDVDQNKKLPDESPIDVASALADIAHSYTKRKHVFRLTTQSRLEMLLQTEDQASLMKWVKAMQTCNEEGHAQKGGRDARTALIIKKKDKQMKAPSSPPPVRKASMPSPTAGRRKNVSTGKTPGEGGGRLPLFELIKNSLRLHRSRNSNDEPDSSSYTTFGVDLDLCPASVENKLVPLVVEFCVHHIEDNGLDVEGLYRVPGTRGMINKLIAELNKGNYHLDFTQWGDIHNYTSLLKAFFNELPDPIVPSNMYHQFVAAAKEHDFNRLYAMKQQIYRLPAGNKHTLKFLLAHLRTVHEHANVNKMSVKNLCIVFGPTLMRCPVHEVGPSYVIMELFLKNMDSFFEDVDLTRDSSDSTGNDMGRLLPKQLNADKQVNVDHGYQRITTRSSSQSDVKVVSSSESTSAVGSIWKRNSPRNPQIHKSPSRSSGDEMISAPLIEAPEPIPEGRVVNIDEAIASRNSIHQDFTNSSINDVSVHQSNGKLDRHRESNRNHRLLGDSVLLDHHHHSATDSSSSSLATASSEEHVYNKGYSENSWDHSHRKKFSSHEQSAHDSIDVGHETRARNIISPYSTHLESDL